MVSPSNAQQHPPPTDLQTDAVRLCIAFQSQLNAEFLGAATELLSCVATLSSTEFRKQSRKIIRLIEGNWIYSSHLHRLTRFRPWTKKTARDTLEASGISLYLFTTASCQKGKRKDVYFDLLRMLQTRRADVDDSLKVRTNSLLVRLSSNFVGRQSAVASSSSSARTPLPDKSGSRWPWENTTAARLAMPGRPSSGLSVQSPDAFPPRAQQSFPPPKAVQPTIAVSGTPRSYVLPETCETQHAARKTRSQLRNRLLSLMHTSLHR
ncbi:hypothetical protein B0H14DRAFT_2966337 [Mycena olivaceomarginata]|nr:hypothetical protein B0H14DRAFT_2966337 [Mycena olivaceomarginata]